MLNVAKYTYSFFISAIIAFFAVVVAFYFFPEKAEDPFWEVFSGVMALLLGSILLEVIFSYSVKRSISARHMIAYFLMSILLFIGAIPLIYFGIATPLETMVIFLITALILGFFALTRQPATKR